MADRQDTARWVAASAKGTGGAVWRGGSGVGGSWGASGEPAGRSSWPGAVAGAVARQAAGRPGQEERPRTKAAGGPRLRRFRPKVWHVLWLAMTLYAAVLLGRMQLATGQVEQELSQVLAEKDQLLREQADLEHELERLRDPAYLEGLARRELRLVKPGETLLVPLPPD